MRIVISLAKGVIFVRRKPALLPIITEENRKMSIIWGYFTSTVTFKFSFMKSVYLKDNTGDNATNFFTLATKLMTS